MVVSKYNLSSHLNVITPNLYIMNLLEKIDQDIKKAMLARDKEKLESLRAVKSALLLQRTEKGAGDINDDAEIKILQRLVKQRKEAADLYVQQGRQDLADIEISQARTIEAYLPEQLSEEELRNLIRNIVEQTGAKDMKDMGKVMGIATKEIAGKADNKVVSAMVKELLS
jgi:uncharacterized protein